MTQRSFRDMLGINAGKEWDQLYNKNNPYGYNPLRNIFTHVRSFHLMEDDYPKGETPATAVPDVQLPGENRGWGRMNNYKLRYQKWAQDFPSIRVSMTGIVEFDKKTQKVRMRKFPSKWYSKAQWGGELKTIKANAKLYATQFAKLYAPKTEKGHPIIDTLEIGNEPWGDVGLEAYQAIANGVIEAFQEYYKQHPRIRLASAAFQAHNPKHIWKAKECPYPTGDYVGKALTREICRELDELTIHPYSFTSGTVRLVEHPESTASEFQHASEMFDFRRQMRQDDMPVSATEYGWDSKLVGEATQAAYLIRNTLQMARQGFYMLYIYEGLDNPGLGNSIYNSSGLFTVKNNQRFIDRPKVGYKVLLQFMELLGEQRFYKCLYEGRTTANKEASDIDNSENAAAYIYLLSDCDNKPSHLVAWQPIKMTDAQKDNSQWLSIKNVIRKERLKLKPTFYKLNGVFTLDEQLRIEGKIPTHRTADYVKDNRKMLDIRLSPTPYVFELA